MEENRRAQPPGRRRRRRLIAGTTAVALLAVGGVIAVQRSAWYDCRFGTDLSAAAPFDYLPAHLGLRRGRARSAHR